jgi:hypothetical protein
VEYRSAQERAGARRDSLPDVAKKNAAKTWKVCKLEGIREKNASQIHQTEVASN